MPVQWEEGGQTDKEEARRNQSGPGSEMEEGNGVEMGSGRESRDLTMSQWGGRPGSEAEPNSQQVTCQPVWGGARAAWRGG